MIPFNPYDHFHPEAATFDVSSEDVKDGIQLRPPQLSGAYGVPGGKDKSPDLSWSGYPPETMSFVVTCYDPDAPTVSGFWHWVVYDIPSTVTSLKAGAGSKDGSELPGGAKTLRNDAGWPGYVGAAAPPGRGPHRYVFAVFALAIDRLPIEETASPAICHSRMHRAGVLGRAIITPTFER